jgi:hypothetical protein
MEFCIMNIIGTLSQEHIDSLLAAGNVASINLARRPIAKVMRFTGSLPDIEALYLRGLYSKDFYVWNTSWVDLYTEAVLQGRGNRNASIYQTQFVWWACGRDIYLDDERIQSFDTSLNTYSADEAVAKAKSTSNSQDNIWGGKEEGAGLFLVNSLHTFYAVRRAFELYALGNGAFYNFRVQLINPHIPYDKYKAIVAINDAIKSIPITGQHIFHFKNLKSSWVPANAQQWDKISRLIK